MIGISTSADANVTRIVGTGAEQEISQQSGQHHPAASHSNRHPDGRQTSVKIHTAEALG